MPPKVVSLRERLQKKWVDRETRQNDARIREYDASGKVSMTCKCPRCEAEHKMFIRWAGRGTPRVYCSTCRSMIASICDETIGQIANLNAKNARKGAYPGVD